MQDFSEQEINHIFQALINMGLQVVDVKYANGLTLTLKRPTLK
jgi:hypothetical protein